MADDDESTASRIPPPDYEMIDGGPLRRAENQAIRLLLERERARERWCRSTRRWIKLGGVGLAAVYTGHQLGVLDWIAGVIVRLRS